MFIVAMVYIYWSSQSNELSDKELRSTITGHSGAWGWFAAKLFGAHQLSSLVSSHHRAWHNCIMEPSVPTNSGLLLHLQHFEIENSTLCCALSAKGQTNLNQSLIKQNDTLVLLMVGWFFLNAPKQDYGIFFAPQKSSVSKLNTKGDLSNVALRSIEKINNKSGSDNSFHIFIILFTRQSVKNYKVS